MKINYKCTIEINIRQYFITHPANIQACTANFLARHCKFHIFGVQFPFFIYLFIIAVIIDFVIVFAVFASWRQIAKSYLAILETSLA